mmetsp:Transcript_52456/g.170345  ORF Transcript_52456/g.170345 Transcript_52456/m.170345 type:complete len:513 (+) Transcript_52456:142-1680(+)
MAVFSGAAPSGATAFAAARLQHIVVDANRLQPPAAALAPGSEFTGSSSETASVVSSALGKAASAAFVAAAGAVLRRRQQRSSVLARQAEATAKKDSVAKQTLANLRKRGVKSADPNKKMPPKPDPWQLDELGNRVFPWPKSFAEIVQTAAYSSMELFMKGETRIEVDFPPLPLADLDWNVCDTAETRIVDANIQHAIAFCKFVIKDPRKFPKLDADEAVKRAMAGAEPQDADAVTEMLERRFAKAENQENMKRSVRVIFPNKAEMLRARDIHYEKWKKMDRPDLIRRGWYDEVNEETWGGPFEDVYVYIIAQESGELTQIRNYVEKADAVAMKQGRVLRHVLFNLNLNKFRNDIQFYKTVTPFKVGLATPPIHFDFLSTFRNSYFIRFGKYTMTILRDPYNIDYVGAMYHAFPSPWQTFMQDRTDLAYRCVDVQDKRPTILAFKRRLQRAFGLSKEAGLGPDIVMDDVYRPQNPRPGTIDRGFTQVAREGFGDFMWWEGDLETEISDRWRLA